MISKNSVLMIIQAFYPTIGGAEKQCLELSKALKERGVNVKVFTERWKGLRAYEEIEGIPVKRLARGGHEFWNSVIFMWAVFIYLLFRFKNYKVIHVHLAASHALGAALIGKILRMKVLVKIGGGNQVGEIALSRKTLKGKLKLWALGLLKPQFVIVSQDQKKELYGFGLEKVPVTLIPNGVDMDQYQPLSHLDKKNLRSRFNLSGLVFLYTGRFNNDKITIEVLEKFLLGWSKAVGQRKDVSFYLVGEGPLELEYRELISRLNLNETVRILSSRNNIHELYQAADVFVLPSLTEGLSNSLLEAMASNLPILASRVPGITDIIEENVHGFLFDPYSSEEVEKCLNRILKDPVAFAELGKNSGETALKNSMAKTVDKYLNLYR